MSSISKSDAKGILNIYAPLLSTNSTDLFVRQLWKQVLDNTKAEKETLEMFKEVGKTKRNPFFRVSSEKQTIIKGKCWKLQQKSPPSTFLNATGTKMTEKYERSNRQQIKL